MTSNYYEILGINRNASEAEIKKAYKELAKKYHPDVSQSKEAEQKMKKINEAYSVLSNRQKRTKYDSPFGGFPFGNINDLFGGFAFNNDNVFTRFEFTTQIQIPFYELILGCKKTVKFRNETMEFTIPEFSQNLSTITVNKDNKFYHLKLIAVLPNKLTDKQKKLIEELSKGGE